MKRAILLLIFTLLTMSFVSAAGEIVSTADKLNYYDTALIHNVTVQNTGTLPTEVNFTVPAGWTGGSGGSCTLVVSTINCILAGGASGDFTLTNPTTDPEYTVTTISPTTNNTYTGNDVSFLMVQDNEIFHTLVEYGTITM